MKHRFSKKRIVLICFILIASTLVIWIAWGNTALEMNRITVTSAALPEDFSGYRIAHVSDLHNAQMGKENEKLIELLKAAEPDMIAITGDIIDSKNTDIDIAIQFVTEAVKIAPCFYVTGNHEAWVAQSVYAELEQQMQEVGVTVLHDSEILLERNGVFVSLIGMDDPDYAAQKLGSLNLDQQIKELTATENYTILLSHRPELFQHYCEAEIDLVLCGHAHGGQFRLPFVGGLVAPDQGLFPEYDAGQYSDGGTNMIVSRGIGNSIIPIRFNNRPEVVLIELQTK